MLNGIILNNIDWEKVQYTLRRKYDYLISIGTINSLFSLERKPRLWSYSEKGWFFEIFYTIKKYA